MNLRLVLLFGVLVMLGCRGGSNSSAPSSGPRGSTPTPQALPAVPVQPEIALTAPTTSPKVGQEVHIALETADARDLYAVGLTVRYDPAQLSYVRYLAGDLLNRDGAPTEIEVVPSEDTPGELIAGVTRMGEVGGVSGSGTLIALVFQAKQSGLVRVQIDDATATLRDADDAPLSVAAWKEVTLTVQ